MKTVGNNGYQIAEKLNQLGLLIDGISVETAEKLIHPYMINPRHLLNDDIWCDFIYACTEDFNITPLI